MAIALLALPTVLATTLHAEFAAPAQAQGDLTVQGTWALLIFHESEDTAFTIKLPGGALHTKETWLVGTQTGTRSQFPVPLPPAEKTLAGSVNGLLQPSSSWASLFIAADSISLEVLDGWANLNPTLKGDYVETHLPQVKLPPGTLNFKPHPSFYVGEDGAVASTQAQEAGNRFHFSLRATGVRHVEWHNATVQCPSSPCPDSGHPWGTPIPGESGLWLRRLSYVHLQTSSGALDGGGEAVAIALGGSSIDTVVNGRLRFPDAYLTGECPEGPCPDASGRTFLAEGNLTLNGLAPKPGHPDRLEGTLSGGFRNAAFDESPAGGFTAKAGLVAGLALVGLGLLVKAGVALFARSARPPALLHPKRRELYQVIQLDPGLSSRAVQRRLDWPTGTLQFHLGRLVESGLVAAQPYRNTVRYFENHGRYTKSWVQVTQLRDPELKRLHDWLLGHPGLDQTSIAAEVQGWGWGRSALRRRLGSLQEAGLIASKTSGRRTQYTANPFSASQST